MASQLLAADVHSASMVESFAPQRAWSLMSLKSSPAAAKLSSSTTSLQWQSGGREIRLFHGNREVRAVYGSRETRLFHGIREARLCLRMREARVFQGSRESRFCHGSTEAGVFYGSAISRVYCGSKEDRVCHGGSKSRVYHGSAETTVFHGSREATVCPGSFLKKKDSLHEKQEQTSTGMVLSHESKNMRVCHCILASFLKRSTSTTEEDEKRRQRSRQYALLSLCAQAMVASHMTQSPLLNFLWKNWPSMVDQLSAGGQGGGKKNFSKGQVDGTREPNNASSLSSCWRVLAMGFLLGIVIAMALTSSMAIGPMVDACLWLCLLCSLLLFVGWVVRTIICTVVFISRGGISSLGKSSTRALQQWVEMSLFQGFLVGVIALITSMFFLDRATKKKARASGFFVTSLWSRLSAKVAGNRVETRRRGRRWQGEPKPSGFLPKMLPKQTKM